MLRMRCAIEHKDCWATNLGRSDIVKDLKYWTGVVLDETRVMCSFHVRTSSPIEPTDYSGIPLAYVDVEKKKMGNDWVYQVDYVVRDPARKSTISLLFASGCIFEPPATVEGDDVIFNILALSREDLSKLERILRQNRRAFRVLSLREIPSSRQNPLVSWIKELTPRQYEALRVAYKKGFYQYPRRTRIEDLAREVGLSRSTFQEHLRLAEAKLIRYMLQLGEASEYSE